MLPRPHSLSLSCNPRLHNGRPSGLFAQRLEKAKATLYFNFSAMKASCVAESFSNLYPIWCYRGYVKNIFHIFIYNRKSVRSEIATLIIKSIFPVHPIAAAIQSVYVCRRYPRKGSYNRYRTNSAAISRLSWHLRLHSLAIASSWQKDYNYFYQVENDGCCDCVILCVSIHSVIGVLYYMRISRAQYATSWRIRWQ
ncbi:LOW QUALITY PROTEIN: hypothetical protein ACHAW5_001214 [Stephanodiscus triporus]|uniref:Uncharacterized protein n=1 Tax=Stephanodiscus triporus TaxID=2934178 RepID=A0ABD3NCM8_9STRA